MWTRIDSGADIHVVSITQCRTNVNIFDKSPEVDLAKGEHAGTLLGKGDIQFFVMEDVPRNMIQWDLFDVYTMENTSNQFKDILISMDRLCKYIRIFDWHVKMASNGVDRKLCVNI